jgi:hypothetical protein
MTCKLRTLSAMMWITLLTLLGGMPKALASGSMAQDDRYIVYYGTVHTRQVPDAIAKKNGIVKSRERGLLTLSIHRKRSDGSTLPVISQLNGSTRHGNGSGMPLDFDITDENGYISYSAPFVFPDGKPLDFEVDVNPSADHPGFRLRFSSTLYAEE